MATSNDKEEVKSEAAASDVKPKKEWYKHGWGLVAAILFLPIFGIWWIWAKTKWNKAAKWGATAAIAILVIVVMSQMSNGSSPEANSTNNSKPAAPTAKTTQTATKPAVAKPATPATPQTPQQKLESSLQSLSNKSIGGTDFSYNGIEVEAETSDRPAGTNQITVKVNVKDFLDKSSLMRDTGQLTSSIDQAVFKSGMKPYDVNVWYIGSTKDTYGNTSNSNVVAYTIDKSVYSKINWSGFDQANFCTWSQNQGKAISADDTETNVGCNILANIQ